MKTEPIVINSDRDMAQLAERLGVGIIRGPGSSWTVIVEGRDEQKYHLVFDASSQPFMVGEPPVKVQSVPRLSFHAARVVGD